MAEKTGEHPDDTDKKDLQGKQDKRKQGNDHSKQADNQLKDFFYHVFHDISLLLLFLFWVLTAINFKLGFLNHPGLCLYLLLKYNFNFFKLILLKQIGLCS